MGFGISKAQVRTIVEEEVADIKAQTDKLAGEAPGESSVTADWEDGILATSGETGANLVTIGTAGDRKKLHALIIDLNDLTLTASITIKLFTLVNGTERKVYSQVFIVGTDPDGIWVVDGTLEIDGVLRVECQSNNAGDNGQDIAYKYDLEDM